MGGFLACTYPFDYHFLLCSYFGLSCAAVRLRRCHAPPFPPSLHAACPGRVLATPGCERDSVQLFVICATQGSLGSDSIFTRVWGLIVNVRGVVLLCVLLWHSWVMRRNILFF